MQKIQNEPQPEHGELRLRMSRSERCMKRTFDFVAALLAIIVFSPIWLILFVVLLIGGGGKVFYRQERLGLHGKPFRIVKFRTMKVNSEAGVPRLEQPNDPRLTRIGKFLRRHHLDELPQLWNVLIGDMSIVGPRPERPFFVQQIMTRDSRYEYLFQLRPGLTSEATLDNGYTNTLDKMIDRLNFDLRYLEKASMKTDFTIIMRTVALVFHGDKPKGPVEPTANT